MKTQSSFRYWQGYVSLELRGDKLEQFINLAAMNRLHLWNIQIQPNNNFKKIMLNTSIHDFFQLRPLLRQAGCRMHVVKRNGFPFFLDKLGGRKFLAGGLLLFIIGLFVMSSVVWQVKVEGNEKLSTSEIIEVAKLQGIHPFQWKFRLGDPDTLSRKLHKRLPDAAWVGIETHGTQITIKVVEATIPEERKLLSPRHLIASKDAMITSITTEKGMPVTKVNAFVRKGDMLISGIIGNEQNHQTVVARGDVRGIVWYHSNIEVPLEISHQTYTGEFFRRSYLMIGRRALQMTGYGKPNYANFTPIIEQKSLHLKSYVLPIGWIREKVMQVEIVKQTWSNQEAKEIGLERGRQSFLRGANTEAKVISEKILHEKAENGKIYIEVYFEVEESIIQEQSIVQGE